MKDKASVLAEVAKLQEIRDELTSEVASLHAQLEQERSKTRTSSVDVKTSKQTVRTRYIVSRFFFKCIWTILCLVHFISFRTRRGRPVKMPNSFFTKNYHCDQLILINDAY